MPKSDKILQFDALHEDWPADATPGAHAQDVLSQYRARFPALEDQIDMLLARGTALQSVQRQLTALYGVSPEPKSREAMATSFGDSDRLVCIVELIRRSLEFASSQNRAAISTALKSVYCASNAQEGFAQLEAFSQSAWGRQYPVIASLWH